MCDTIGQKKCDSAACYSDQYINRNLNDDCFHDDDVNLTKCQKAFYKFESFLFRIFYGEDQESFENKLNQ